MLIYKIYSTKQFLMYFTGGPVYLSSSERIFKAWIVAVVYEFWKGKIVLKLEIFHKLDIFG